MSSGVVRVGDTVGRPAGRWTPAVHALLAHLHEAGFRGAPAWPDYFHLLDGDAQLSWAAGLIRDFHDAVTGFAPPPDARLHHQREGQRHQALLG